MGIACSEAESTWEGSSCWDWVILESNVFPARLFAAWSVVCAFLGICWSFDVGFLFGCTTCLFPCIESECMESYLMSKTDGSTRVYACCTGGSYKVLSLCVIRIEESLSENLMNLYNLDLWSISPIAMMEFSCMSIIETESDVNSTFLPLLCDLINWEKIHRKVWNM